MERKGRMRVDTWLENNETTSRKVSYLDLEFIQGRKCFRKLTMLEILIWKVAGLACTDLSEFSFNIY